MNRVVLKWLSGFFILLSAPAGAGPLPDWVSSKFINDIRSIYGSIPKFALEIYSANVEFTTDLERTDAVAQYRGWGDRLILAPSAKTPLGNLDTQDTTKVRTILHELVHRYIARSMNSDEQDLYQREVAGHRAQGKGIWPSQAFADEGIALYVESLSLELETAVGECQRRGHISPLMQSSYATAFFGKDSPHGYWTGVGGKQFEAKYGVGGAGFQLAHKISRGFFPAPRALAKKCAQGRLGRSPKKIAPAKKR